MQMQHAITIFTVNIKKILKLKAEKNKKIKVLLKSTTYFEYTPQKCRALIILIISVE